MSDRGNAVDGGMDAWIRFSWTKHRHGPRLMELWNTGLWVDGQIRVNVNYGNMFVSRSIFKGTLRFSQSRGIENKFYHHWTISIINFCVQILNKTYKTLNI